MRCLLLLLLALLYLGNSAHSSPVLSKLIAVNSHWQAHAGAAKTHEPAGIKDENGWIQYHLQLVEAALRRNVPAGLTQAQLTRRNTCLDSLRTYYRAGRFPANDFRPYRTPVFIDRCNTFCAVGYLMKTSGFEALARRVSVTDNFAYVLDMRIAGLQIWASAHGFTTDELAWIQPGYPQTGNVAPVGEGTDGAVYELYADTLSDRLYVGGAFRHVDSIITARNIAYITDSSGHFVWRALDSGVNGPVRAITSFGGNIFIAGIFSKAGSDSAANVAFWNGSEWKAAGCLAGDVRDLAVMGGNLYASGRFTTCVAPDTVSLAAWNGTAWLPVRGITGQANVLYAEDTTLIIGGAFHYGTNMPNIIKWSAGAGFKPFARGSLNEVLSIAQNKGTLYAGCNRTGNVDSTALLLYRVGDGWQDVSWKAVISRLAPDSNAIAFRTLCAAPYGWFYGGGNFMFWPGIGCAARGVIAINVNYGLNSCDAFYINGPVYKMEVFHQNLFTGGDFITGGNYPHAKLNNIGRTIVSRMGVATSQTAPPISLSPNPAHSGGRLIVYHASERLSYSIFSITGAQLTWGVLEHGEKQEILLNGILPGAYFIRFISASGNTCTTKFMVQ